MEKCTYCVQRISAARIRAKAEEREIKDGRSRRPARPPAPRGPSSSGTCRSQEPGRRVEGLPLELRVADRAEHPAADHVPGAAQERQPRDREGVTRCSPPDPSRFRHRRWRAHHRPRVYLRLHHRQDQPDRPVAETPRSWLLGVAIAFLMLQALLVSSPSPSTTAWGPGASTSHRLGLRHRQFRLWDRDRPRRDPDLAILLLLRQPWRTSINRFAEAMTLFAVSCAGIFPLIHMGRPWFAYWMFPYPNTMGLWPQTRSPLVWDVFAVSTYATVSALFWYVGLVPDLATLRDRAGTSSCRSCTACWLSAARLGQALAPLRDGLPAPGRPGDPPVLSVHTVVSFDFAVSLIPGWHSTIFPPYFVAGPSIPASPWC